MHTQEKAVANLIPYDGRKLVERPEVRGNETKMATKESSVEDWAQVSGGMKECSTHVNSQGSKGWTLVVVVCKK